MDIHVAASQNNADANKLATPILEIPDRCQTEKIYAEYRELAFPSELTVELMSALKYGIPEWLKIPPLRA